ncbi:MAG: hypothetical protein U0414_08940 [Polyangiaceae bacterium]
MIDPASFHSFAERFLGRSKKKHPFDKSFRDGASLLEDVPNKIKSEPEEGARLLLQLCLMWCSAETPHEYSRNLALSYWFRAGEAQDFPMRLCAHTLSPYLREIEEEHPELKGRLTLGFDGNYAVGYFIAPQDVPAAREFVEGQMAEVVADTRRALEPLLKILRVAEEKKMAYWEATDLNVANGNAAWLKEKKVKPALSLQTIAEIPGLYHFATLTTASDPIFIMSAANPDNTYIVDLSTSPAKVTHLPETFFSRAELQGDVVLAIARHKHKNPYGLYKLTLRPQLGQMELLYTSDDDLSDLAIVGGEVLLIPKKIGTKPRWVSTQEELQVPASTDYYSKGFRVVPFGDNSHLLCWHKKFYLLEGREAKPLQAPEAFQDLYLSHGLEHNESWSDAPGRALMPSSTGMMQITKEGGFRFFAPELNAIRQISRGPDRAIIVWQGDNESDDLLKILWPTMEISSIKPKDLGLKEIQGMFWSGALQSVVMRAGTTFIALSWEQIKRLARRSLGEIAAKQEADKKKEADRKHKVWKENVEKKLSYTRPIELPVPPHGIQDGDRKKLFVFSGDLIRHPTLGLGLILSKYTEIDKELSVQFEHEERRLNLTDPIKG